MFSCQRCEKSEAQYRVKTELLTIFVCEECADKALEMGFPVNDVSVELTESNSRARTL